MKIELGKYSFLFFILLIATQFVVYAGGNQDRNIENNTSDTTRKLIWASSERPDWVDNVPQNNSEFYFVGTSQPYDTVANARDNSREDARNQVLKFYGEFVERQARESGTMSGSTRDTLEAFIAREDEIRSYAENIISQVGTDRYYSEIYLNSNNKEEHIVYTLCQVSRKKAEEDISNFARNISQRYTGMLTQRATLKATLESYVVVLKALEQNTLHRIIAYHDGTAGRVGLYSYVRANIIDLTNSISFGNLQNRIVRKPDTLDTNVRLQSVVSSIIGPFDCKIIITGMNMDIPVVNYTVNDNSFFMTFITTPLKIGRYSVQIELLLNEITGGIVKNINTGFNFEVIPLTAVLRTKEEMEEGIKRTIDILANNLQTQTQTRIGLFSLDQTDIPTGLSRYLTQRVTEYAMNNPNRKYQIRRENIQQVENTKLVLLSGFFVKRGNNVDITFELNTPDGKNDSSQTISVAVDLLKSQELTYEPENVNILTEDPIIIPINNGINIQAFFNSTSQTYMHRDELGITVLADKNCYFKIIHIDVNNQMKMLYPNNLDKNNYLRANTPRVIFESAKAFLYEPYGTETIIITASTEQFENINQDLIAPLTTANESNVRSAVRGERGVTIEGSFSLNDKNNLYEGEAKYNITILKPNESYEYARPDNMREFYDSLRRDILNQGGTFEGNEVSGVYILNGIRSSYRLPRDKPNKIQFAIYNLNNFTGERNTGVITRSRGFNFSFIKPVNMIQAVQTVRTGIEESGGTFTGNEQQGNFRANGISGQYNVTDLVNVTITEKPFVIPNSLIEKEVKSFFTVR